VSHTFSSFSRNGQILCVTHVQFLLPERSSAFPSHERVFSSHGRFARVRSSAGPRIRRPSLQTALRSRRSVQFAGPDSNHAREPAPPAQNLGLPQIRVGSFVASLLTARDRIRTSVTSLRSVPCFKFGQLVRRFAPHCAGPDSNRRTPTGQRPKRWHLAGGVWRLRPCSRRRWNNGRVRLCAPLSPAFSRTSTARGRACIATNSPA